MAFNFFLQFQGQMILFHYIKVSICWFISVFFSKHLLELSPILSIIVGQIMKTKVGVNLKYNKIIIIFLSCTLIAELHARVGGAP